MAGSVRRTAVLGLLAVSLVINVGLAWRMHAARQEIAFLSAALAYRNGNGLKVGSRLSVLKGMDAQGHDVTLNLAAGGPKGTILYIFSPECHWCFSNLSRARALYDGSRDLYRFVAVSLTDRGLDAYIHDHEISYPVIKSLDPSSLRALPIRATPSTLVISSAGTVLALWTGAYIGQNRDQVQAFFNLTLPRDGLDAHAKGS